MKRIYIQTRNFYHLLVKSKAMLLILIAALFLLTIVVKDIIEKTLLQ